MDRLLLSLCLIFLSLAAGHAAQHLLCISRPRLESIREAPAILRRLLSHPLFGHAFPVGSALTGFPFAGPSLPGHRLLDLGRPPFPAWSPGPCIWMRRVPAVFTAAGPSPIWARWGPWSPSCSLEKRPSPSWHCSGSARKCSTSGSPFLWHAVSGAAKVRSVCAPSGLILCCCSS